MKTESEKRQYLIDNLRILIGEAAVILDRLNSGEKSENVIEPLQEVGNHIFKIGERVAP
jgi:hypothetical protein